MGHDSIIRDITEYIKKFCGDYSDWYVGIASSPKERLFDEHNVEKNGGNGWIYRDADTENIAREIEAYFINQKKTRGGTGGGIHPRYVYAYKITHDTIQ